jgi:exonuclease III
MNSDCAAAFLNVCSLRHKVDDVGTVLRRHDLDLFGIAETWLDPTISDGELAVGGYSLVRHDGIGRADGGVCIYFKSSLSARPRPDLQTAGVEAVWLEIKGQHRTMLFGCVYRPPGETVAYWDQLETAIHTVCTDRMNGLVVIVGDFNVNLCSSSPNTKRVADIYSACGLFNHVGSPTRYSPATLMELCLIFF